MQVVRIKTSSWWDGRKLVLHKEIIPMKRLSDSALIKEDVDAIGAMTVCDNIVNLHEVMDGLYSLVMCDIRKDWETGYIEDYSYKLTTYLN